MSLKYHDVVLRLPKMPRRFPAGDDRNYRRWHAWIEAVKVLAAHCRGARAPRPDRRRHVGR
jgi:hypothetical protein